MTLYNLQQEKALNILPTVHRNDATLYNLTYYLSSAEPLIVFSFPGPEHREGARDLSHFRKARGLGV